MQSFFFFLTNHAKLDAGQTWCTTYYQLNLKSQWNNYLFTLLKGSLKGSSGCAVPYVMNNTTSLSPFLSRVRKGDPASCNQHTYIRVPAKYDSLAIPAIYILTDKKIAPACGSWTFPYHPNHESSIVFVCTAIGTTYSNTPLLFHFFFLVGTAHRRFRNESPL